MNKAKACDDWLTLSETARELGVSKQTIWRMIKAGELKSCRLHKSPRITRQVLMDYLNNLTDPKRKDRDEQHEST